MEKVSFKLNGKSVSLNVDGERMLLWVLRTEQGLTGTKYGCGGGYCGSCTVLVGNRPLRSCQVAMKSLAGKEVVTIEGLEQDGKLQPIQDAFIEHDALQCGFCIPGMVVAAHGLLQRSTTPTLEEINQRMNGNICRCGAHKRIVQAIQTAGKNMNKG